MARSRDYFHHIHDPKPGERGSRPWVSSDQVTSSAVIKAGPGLLGMVVVEETDAGADQVVTIYDHASSASGVVLAEVYGIGGAAGETSEWTAPDGGVWCETGIYVEITGDAKVIVYYQ